MAVDFTKQMKRDFTILAPDIFPTHMELLQEVFALHGYHVEVLHDEGPAVIAAGLKYLHNDMCYPATCAIGQQLYALTSGKYDPHRVALIQFQTGGGCRASNYIFLLRKALHNMGMDYVPVISLSFGGYEHYSGFKITPLMLFAGLRSLIYGDMLMLLKNQCLPYETNPGDARKVIQKWIAELTGQFRRKQGLTPKAMQKNLRAMAKDFHEIPRTPKDCTKVGIVGEIYVKYSSFGSNGLEQFLLSQGCEYMVPGVLGFFQYCFANIEMDHKYYGGSRLKLLCDLGAAVITEDSLSPFAEKFHAGVRNQWTYHARMYAAAKYVAESPDDLHVVQLVSFGCGVDAVTTDEVRAILEAAGKDYTQLKIDEITNMGAASIRLRSLFAMLDEKNRKRS